VHSLRQHQNHPIDAGIMNELAHTRDRVTLFSGTLRSPQFLTGFCFRSAKHRRTEQFRTTCTKMRYKSTRKVLADFRICRFSSLILYYLLTFSDCLKSIKLSETCTKIAAFDAFVLQIGQNVLDCARKNAARYEDRRKRICDFWEEKHEIFT
jgi:hypothetical protein